jgi:hypothetical protein
MKKFPGVSIAARPLRPFTYEMRVNDAPAAATSIWLDVTSGFPDAETIGDIHFMMDGEIGCYAIDRGISRDQLILDNAYVRCFKALIPDLGLRQAWERTVGQPWKEPLDGSAGPTQSALDKLWNERWDTFQPEMMELVREASVDLHISLAAPPSPSIPFLLEIVCQRFFAEPITSTPHGILIPYSGKMLWHSRPLTFEEHYAVSKTK